MAVFLFIFISWHFHFAITWINYAIILKQRSIAITKYSSNITTIWGLQPLTLISLNIRVVQTFTFISIFFSQSKWTCLNTCLTLHVSLYMNIFNLIQQNKSWWTICLCPIHLLLLARCDWGSVVFSRFYKWIIYILYNKKHKGHLQNLFVSSKLTDKKISHSDIFI